MRFFVLKIGQLFKKKMAHSRPPKKRQKKLDAAPSTAEVVDNSYQKVYVVLERACLETIKTKKVAFDTLGNLVNNN